MRDLMGGEMFMAGSYKFLEHTADVLFEASGDSFEEALEAAADALFGTICDAGKVGERKVVEVSDKADNLEDLVAFTLSDLLSEMDAEELFLKRFKVDNFGKREGGFFIEGKAHGSEMNPAIGRTVVKGVTHGMLKVEEQKGKWKIRVLLDI